MGRQKRSVPKGRLRMVAPKDANPTKKYTIYYEYIWNTKPIRKSTDVKCTVGDWNPKGNSNIGELRKSFGTNYKHVNAAMVSKLEKIDAKLLKYNVDNPNRITADVIHGFLYDEPLMRADKGKDFVEFALERLSSKLSRNKIGQSRYENGKSSLKMLTEFLASNRLGTYKADAIYVSEITTELLDKYIDWRKNIKKNQDETINHALTPILSACKDACDLGYISNTVNAQIQETRIVIKPSIDETDVFDDKYLTKEQLALIVEKYNECREARRKDFLEMFFFAFHACGLRMIDIITLQWANINFERKELTKCLVKTKNRHVIPLTKPALAILEKWKTRTGENKFVFGFLDDEFNLNDEEALYRKRNNFTRCINQSIVVVGRMIGLPFPLTMHVARHTFAVFALNDGLNMSMVSRLLGHSSTDITEKVYAKFLPTTLADEVNGLKYDFLPLL